MGGARRAAGDVACDKRAEAAWQIGHVGNCRQKRPIDKHTSATPKKTEDRVTKSPAWCTHEAVEASAKRNELDELYRSHFDSMWRMARALGVPQHQLDDVVQETFLIALRNHEGFEGRSSLRTWLTGILVRVATKYRRARKMDALTSEPCDTAQQADEAIAQTQARQLLLRLLGELTEKNRQVWVLTEIEKLSAHQIAEALGVSPNTVSSRLRLARKQLERQLVRHKAREGYRR